MTEDPVEACIRLCDPFDLECMLCCEERKDILQCMYTPRRGNDYDLP